MTDLHAVLTRMGYREVCTAETGEWTPTAAEGAPFDGETTETLHVLVWKRKPTAVLRDPETGETVGTARQSCTLEIP